MIFRLSYLFGIGVPWFLWLRYGKCALPPDIRPLVYPGFKRVYRDRVLPMGGMTGGKVG